MLVHGTPTPTPTPHPLTHPNHPPTHTHTTPTPTHPHNTHSPQLPTHPHLHNTHTTPTHSPQSSPSRQSSPHPHPNHPHTHLVCFLVDSIAISSVIYLHCMKLAWEGKGERWAVSDGCRGLQTIFSPRRFPLLSKATAHTVDWCPSSVAKEDLEGEGVGVGGREGGVQCR